MGNKLSLLVAIASYGRAQDHYLEKVISEYHKLKMLCKIMVLSNVNKPVAGAEIILGLPSANPFSLPFAHRKLFSDNLEKFDLFIYAEDDTMLADKNIESFLSLQPNLEDGEILGFLRSETSLDGKKYITSIHSHFRWLPDTVVKRNGELFAELSNQHSGCFIANRRQLKKAIESGGFLVKPYMDAYGMLESAASDIYTRCGLRRLISLSRINDFIVPHLPNKYYKKMGIPIEELEFQTRFLIESHQNGRWNGSLFTPQTRLPGFCGSKTLFEKPDEKLLGLIPPAAKSLLSVGCGWGESELWLSKKGIGVTAVPIDSVFGEALRRRGIETVEGPIDEVNKELGGRQFDVVLIADVLHLVENPLDWLQKLRNLIAPGGYLIASVSNISEVLSWVKDRRDGRRRPLYSDYRTYLAHSVSARQLRGWCRTIGLEMRHFGTELDGPRRFVKKLRLKALEPAFSTRFLVVAERTT
jgi:2-polyprenyl-3-methyl-5-hydroxy-6-metoxy-1,4-benzoquinol methylase